MNVEELYELVKNDEGFKSLILKLKDDKTISNEDASKTLIDYFSSKDIKVTNDLLKEMFNSKLFSPKGKELLNDELASINGGKLAPYWENMCTEPYRKCHNGSESFFYPKPSCSATVEIESWCMSDDLCYLFDKRYEWIHR